MSIKIQYGRKSLSLLKQFTDTSELSGIFQVSEENMLLKVKRDGEYTTLWPDERGRFHYEETDKEAILLAVVMDEDNDSTLPFGTVSSSSTPSSSHLASRASSSTSGGFTFPSTKINMPSINFSNSKKRLRGNACLSTGNRCVPPLKKTTLTTYKYKPVMKSISISEVIDGQPETMFKINVDLGKIERSCGKDFTVIDISEELKLQLDSDQVCVITDVKGFPIKDTPGNRGLKFWDTKRKEIRAFDVELFGNWKPSVWKIIMKDYSVMLPDVDIYLSSDSEFEEPKKSGPTAVNHDQESRSNDILELREVITDLNNLNNDLRSKLVSVATPDTSEVIKESITCKICYDLNFYFYFCQNCGVMAGCFICCYRLNKCPQCRVDFPSKDQRKPNFIQGLAVACGAEPPSLSELQERVSTIPVLSDSESTN